MDAVPAEKVGRPYLSESIDPNFNKLMAGYESQDIKVVRELWRLSRRAVELGLGDVFKTKEDEGVIKELQRSKAGVQWLDEYGAFLEEHGWRCERMHAYDTPAWIEKPSQGISRVKMLMTKDVFPLDTEKGRVIEERKKTEQEVLAKVPGGQRDAFAILMKAAQKSGYWSEDHTYFCDFYVGSMGRWIVTEFGRRFAEAGCIDGPEDIHFLHPNEIRKAAIPMGRINLRPYVEPRKKAWEENMRSEPVPFFGDISQAQAGVEKRCDLNPLPAEDVLMRASHRNALRAVLLSCLAATVPASVAAESARVVHDGATRWRVYVPETAGAVERFAAAELRKYVRRMTGVALAETSEAGAQTIHVGVRADLGDASLPPPKPGFDGYSISVSSERIVLAGENPRGVLYAVYDLLERAGCRWWQPTLDPKDPEVVPKRTEVTFEEGQW